MNIKIERIPLEKIVPLFQARIHKNYFERIRKIEMYLVDSDLILRVEKHTAEDMYLLVGNYDIYYYLMDHTNKMEVPCIIETSASTEEMLFKTLHRLFSRGDINKDNRKLVIGMLKTFGVSDKIISTRTGLTIKDLKNNYFYNKNIDKGLINGFTTEKTMNWIEQLPLKEEVKNEFYRRAGLPHGDKERFTNENVILVKKALKLVPDITQLKPFEIIKIIHYITNYKGNMFKGVKDIVYNFLKFRKTG